MLLRRAIGAHVQKFWAPQFPSNMKVWLCTCWHVKMMLYRASCVALISYPNKCCAQECALDYIITVELNLNIYWIDSDSGVWEFLFPADFLLFENFLVPKFQLFLLFSAYFCHFCPISRCFSLYFCLWPLTHLLIWVILHFKIWMHHLLCLDLELS